MSKRSIARRIAKVGAVAAVGLGVALTAGTASAVYTPGPVTHDNYGIGNGNQVVAPIQIPVNVCGNAVAVAGVAGAGCDGGAEANLDVETALGDMFSTDNFGVGNGNQVQAPIQVPINVCGNAVAVLGVAGAGCDGGAEADMEADVLPDMTTFDNYGIGNGNQVVAPVQVPVDVSGNAVSVAGLAGAGSGGGAEAVIGSVRDDVHAMFGTAEADALGVDEGGCDDQDLLGAVPDLTGLTG